MGMLWACFIVVILRNKPVVEVLRKTHLNPKLPFISSSVVSNSPICHRSGKQAVLFFHLSWSLILAL